MKHLVWFGVAVVGVPLCMAWAQPLANPLDSPKPDRQYHACLVRYVKPARSPLAAKHLSGACRKRYATTERLPQTRPKTGDAPVYDFMPDDMGDDWAYHTCLMRYLPSVTNDHSAAAMVQLCTDQHSPVTDATPSIQEKHRNILDFFGLNPPQKETPDLTIDGGRFIPLRPWQGGQRR